MTDLIEVMPFSYQILESESGRFKVEGVFQRSDVENANKRVYPRSIWERELKEPRVTESLTNRAMFGELDHPADGKTSLKRVSHLVTGLNLQDDGSVVGVAEVLGTPNGQILKTLFESGAQVGISSRGSGSVQNGVVQEDFKLSTFDFVARPSTPGALPRPAGEASGRGSRTEDAEDIAASSVLVTDVVDADLFKQLQHELALLDESIDPDLDFNTLARSVIELHNLTEGLEEITPEERSVLNDHILVLSGELTRLAANSPEHRAIVTDLLQKVEESLGAVISQPTNNVKEEPMDRLQFIKDRLQEAKVDAEAELQTEVDELRQELEDLSDDELIEVALEAGVISPEDLDEDDAEEAEAAADGDDEVTVQDLLDYIEEMEGQLGEAAELIEGLATELEESGDADDIKLKYEAALGIIQETVTRYHFLQEAVGGEENANKLMESHLQKLELSEAKKKSKKDDDEDDDEDDEKEEGVQEALVEDLLNENKVDSTMLRYKELAESALSRSGLKN